MGYKYNPFTGQLDRVGAGSGSAAIETLTGNSGGAVGPDGSFNVNLLGSGKYSFTGNAGTNTLTLDDDGTIADTYISDSGSATPNSGTLNVLGGILLNTSASGNSLTINADDNVVGSISGDSGSVTPSSNSFTIAGGSGCVTTGAGTTLTVDLEGDVPLSFPTDAGTAIPGGNSLTVGGGTNINTSGSGNTVTINLDDNISTGTIDASQLTIDPGSSGDSFVQFNINSTSEFRIGVDDDDGDTFKISQGNALGTNDTQIITPEGEVTFPLTPAFLATLGSPDTDVTGAGTAYVLGTNVALTEIFDQNSDFNTNGTFTASVPGKYEFSGTITVQQISSSMGWGQINVVTSNRSYQGMAVGADNSKSTGSTAPNTISYTINCISDLDAGDTAQLQIQIFDGAGDTVDLNASGTNTYFSGILAA